MESKSPQPAIKQSKHADAATYMYKTKFHKNWMKEFPFISAVHQDPYRYVTMLALFKACSYWIQIQNGSVTELPNANSMQIQCKSNAHWSRPHCIVQNRIHVCMLTSSGHTSTQLPWRPHQIFTSASNHIASRVKQTCGTQCVAQRSALTVGSRHERECHAFLVLTRKAQLCDPVQCALGVQCEQAFKN